MTAESPSTTDRLAEAPNPHIFRLWEELGTGLMEVECEAPDCDWKATFNPPITAEMKAQAIRVQREHRESFALKSLVDSLRARLDTAEGQLAQAVKVVADRDAEWKANSEDWARHPSTNIHDDRLRDQEQAIANEIADLHTEFVRALGPDGEGSR